MNNLVNVVFNINSLNSPTSGSLRECHKKYVFATYEELKEGDIVVVDAQFGYRLATVTVVSVVEKLPRDVSLGNSKEVVSKVSFDDFTKRKEKVEKIKTLKGEMDKKVKVLQNQAVYELLAEKDQGLKAMLEEYKWLLNEEY